MSSNRSLRSRIVLAYLLLAALLCLLFSTITYASMVTIETELLNVRLRESAHRLVQNYLAGYRPGPGEPEVAPENEIPDWLRSASTDVHEVTIGERKLHVVVVAVDGKRYAVVQDESGFERIEGYVWAALAAASLICMFTAFMFGSATASRVIRPLTGLAEAVIEGRVASSPSMSSQDELGVLARAFAAKNDEMAAFLERERLFTGDVSHELRTPLTVILGAAELLQARLNGSAELLPIIERVRRTALDTAGRVAALLMLSRSPEAVEAPAIELAPLIRQEYERWRSLLGSEKVSMYLHIGGAPVVLAHPELVSMAAGNLIRNACQFTHEGEIRVELDDTSFAVMDTGPGIPEHLRHSLFERFVRHAPETTGTGLGLAIVRRICEHLNWTVSMKAQPDGGSCFVINFGRPGMHDATGAEAQAASAVTA